MHLPSGAGHDAQWRAPNAPQSERAGYVHHGSFTAAFTRQFGYPPKLLRHTAARDSST